MAVWGGLTRIEVKSKGEKERYTHLNAEFQRKTRRDKKAFFSDQCKEIEENIGKTLSGINHKRILYDPPPRVLEIKAKINKWDLIKLKSFCTTKETISKVKRQPSESETNNKRSSLQIINLKNIQAAPEAQFQENKWPNEKMGQRTKQTFLQRRHTNGLETHEKMLNITDCQRNENQNHNEVQSQASQNSYYPKFYKQ